MAITSPAGNTAFIIASGRNPTFDAASAASRCRPQAYFVGSAIFHYLGPSFAVLLFARVDVLGVAWLRIASAARGLRDLAAALADVSRRSIATDGC